MKRLWLTHGVQRIDNLAVHQAEVAGVERDVHVGDVVDEAIEDQRRQLLETTFALALAAYCVDNFMARLPALDHLQN